jgi:hypothetical protein
MPSHSPAQSSDNEAVPSVIRLYAAAGDEKAVGNRWEDGDSLSGRLIA